MCTSLQTIVNSCSDSRLQQDIEQLFQYKPYPRFQLREFYTHPLFQQNEQFHFFIDILEEWNRKEDQQQLPNSSYTLYYKNVYIYNNLRTAILQLPPYAKLVLQKLSQWYNNTRNNKIKVIEKKHQQQQVDEAWEIRNTFKSNLPAEIDLYRRRLFWNFPEKENVSLRKSSLNDTKSRKIKTECENTEATQRELQHKRLIKIENDVVRFEREKNELMEVEARWKVKKAREEEFMVKNFYNGGFSTCKTYFPKRGRQEPDVTHPILKRSQTSSGVRYKKAVATNLVSPAANVTSKQGFRKSQDVTEKFQEFDVNEVRLSDVTGINLLYNPSQKKLKKKNRRR